MRSYFFWVLFLMRMTNKTIASCKRNTDTHGLSVGDNAGVVVGTGTMLGICNEVMSTRPAQHTHTHASIDDGK